MYTPAAVFVHAYHQPTHLQLITAHKQLAWHLTLPLSFGELQHGSSSMWLNTFLQRPQKREPASPLNHQHCLWAAPCCCMNAKVIPSSDSSIPCSTAIRPLQQEPHVQHISLIRLKYHVHMLLNTCDMPASTFWTMKVLKQRVIQVFSFCRWPWVCTMPASTTQHFRGVEAATAAGQTLSDKAKPRGAATSLLQCCKEKTRTFISVRNADESPFWYHLLSTLHKQIRPSSIRTSLAPGVYRENGANAHHWLLVLKPVKSSGFLYQSSCP